MEDYKIVSRGRKDFFVAKFMLSDKKVIEIRRVMGMMEFLGEAGGTYEALSFVAIVVNFFFTGREKAL